MSVGNPEAPPANAESEASRLSRTAELQGAVLFFSRAIQMAAINYDPSQPEDVRKSLAIALVGAIHLISAMHPNEPSFMRPLNELLYGLMDLDHGKVVAFLKAAKVPHSPGNSLADELFKAIPSAAMTCLVDARLMTREGAAQDIARRLARAGLEQLSGKPITDRQIKKWRERMMEGLPSESFAVARYRWALEWVKNWEPRAAVEFLLRSLIDLTAPKNPKNPPA
jgi:hypothetical protein